MAPAPKLPTPSLISRTGFTVCIHRRAETMVEFGVIRPVSSSLSLPLCLAASLSRSTFGLSPLGLQGSEVGGEWVRRRRWVPWSSLTCGPARGGACRLEKKKRETAVGSEYFAAGAVHGTMHLARSTSRCRVTVGEGVSAVGPALGQRPPYCTACCNPYLIACIDSVSSTSA